MIGSWLHERLPRKRLHAARHCLLVGVMLSLWCGSATAQTAWLGGRQWRARRAVVVPQVPNNAVEVCVVEFLCHGELNDMQPGLTVVAGSEPVSVRMLQRGPGDFVRLAFQTKPGSNRYGIYYGGSREQAPPAWSATAGLLWDVRKFRPCDLTRLDSVRASFERAESLGSTYVDTVFQGSLPFAAPETPVLARFTGSLRIAEAGTYRIYTSSRDASWLLVDGKTVVSWPGRHNPTGQGRQFGDVELTVGTHPFEYHHATEGGGYVAVAAWRVPGETKITPIPADVFGGVRFVRAEPPQIRSGGTLPDFAVQSLAEATLGPGEQPLVKVRFTMTKSVVPMRWDFGDGQTATAAHPEHVYLHPGEYVVRCARIGGRAEVEQRVAIEPPWQRLADKDSQADIADWLPELRNYNVRTLTAEALRQLVLVHRELGDDETAALIGLSGLREHDRKSGALEARPTARLAETLATLLEHRLGRVDEAVSVCDTALAMDPGGEFAMRLQLLAAQFELQWGQNDACARRLAELAKLVAKKETVPLGKGDSPLFRLRLAELQGDFFRRAKDATAARQAYAAAQKLAESEGWDPRRRIAMQGTYSRNIEDALQTGRLDEADALLDTWSSTMPACKLTGYFSLLRARCDLARGRYRTAVLETEDLLAVAADSPYADRLLLVAAEAEARLGNDANAKGWLQRLVRDYPGSPHVAQARRWLEQGIPTQEARKTNSPRRPAGNSATGAKP